MHGVNVSVYLKRKYKRTNNDLQTHRTSKTLIVICINCIRYILSNTCHRFRHLTKLNGAYKKKYTREVSVRIKVGLYSGCDSDATELQCRFQHRYPIAATTQVIADHR